MHMLSLTEDEVDLNGRNQYFLVSLTFCFSLNSLFFLWVKQVVASTQPFQLWLPWNKSWAQLSSVPSFYSFNSSRLTAGRPRNDGRGRYSQISQHENLFKNYNQSAFFPLINRENHKSREKLTLKPSVQNIFNCLLPVMVSQNWTIPMILLFIG